MNQRISYCTFLVLATALVASTFPLLASAAPTDVAYRAPTCDAVSLRMAIEDLIETYGDAYEGGTQFLAELTTIEATDSTDPAVPAKLHNLAWRSLLANPLLDFERLVLLKRKRGQLGLPTNHQCNATLNQKGYDNEIAVLSPPRPMASMTTLFRPKEGNYVGEIDLDYDADRLLFTMPNGQTWEVQEIGIDGSGLRQVTPTEPDVDNFDACYLPDGNIVFSSTASFTAVPCWHGKERACSIYRINSDGSGKRQLCFDQDLDLHASVLPNGQVIYSRWEYAGVLHAYVRPLMVMNPDGTNQRAIYGSNSYYPNSLYYPRAIGGSSTKLVAVLTGYHGINRAGELAILDTQSGWQTADGVVHRLMHREEAPKPIIKDDLLDSAWPRYIHPYPLSEKYFLTAAQLSKDSPWGIYLVDIFDNMLPIHADPKFDLFEPIPVLKRPRPDVIPERVNLARDDATVYMHDVYAGPGLAGVPRGAVKRMRIVAYNYGYPGMAGPDKIGRAGPMEAMRILGTVPVHEDGSAHFRIPAGTPITLQPLDAEGKALQVMRSWYTAMPGERASCVGCHEQPRATPVVRRDMAASLPVSEIEPWYGPARGFDFEREVQPVLDRYCVDCHDQSTVPDLRAERFATNYQGLPLTGLGSRRLTPELRDVFPVHENPSPSYPRDACAYGDRRTLYTPAYEALIPYIRRVNVEDQVGLLVPGEYHADTSELIQILKKGHHGVELDAEAWDRLVTWIDMNGPCHGTWGDVYEIPEAAGRRRLELARQYGGPSVDPEAVPEVARESQSSSVPKAERVSTHVSPEQVDGWPFDAQEASLRQQRLAQYEISIDLGRGVQIRMTRIPSGRFVMGSAASEAPDEGPQSVVTIERDFWIGTCEVTNRQFRRFYPSHDSGVFTKRQIDINGPGIAMNEPEQPAMHVSWDQAMAFCRWLSEETGARFMLPTEAQWEYACRAGSDDAMSWGPTDADFSGLANLADTALDTVYESTSGLHVLQPLACDTRFNDAFIATAAVGTYHANAWGLHDMHGNASEWTLSAYQPYPYRDSDGRNDPAIVGRRVVRGGSYFDRPKKATSAHRLDYPAWQRVHNVGFRVVCESRP